MPLQVDFSKLDAIDFLDLAIEVEKEARDHYHQLRGWIATDESSAHLVEFFDAMADRELKHQRELEEQRRSLFGDAPKRRADVAVWDVEAPDYDALGTRPTLREALEMALDMETRAFRYYTDAKEYVTDPKIITILDGFRRAEAEHQRLVKDQLKALGD